MVVAPGLVSVCATRPHGAPKDGLFRTHRALAAWSNSGLGGGSSGREAAARGGFFRSGSHPAHVAGACQRQTSMALPPVGRTDVSGMIRKR